MFHVDHLKERFQATWVAAHLSLVGCLTSQSNTVRSAINPTCDSLRMLPELRNNLIARRISKDKDLGMDRNTIRCPFSSPSSEAME